MRDPRKLYRLARQRDLDVTQAMTFEALKADVAARVGRRGAQRPAAGRPHRLQPEHAGEDEVRPGGDGRLHPGGRRGTSAEQERRDGGPGHQARRAGADVQQGLAPLRAADGHGVHGPQPLHVAVLVEAPRRVRRRSEGARVLHGLHAPVGEVLVVLELVGVVLEDPELRGRLLLHVLGRAVHRLVGPRVVGPGRPLKVVAPLPALARHPRGQVLLQRLDAPVHHGSGVAVLGPLRPAHGLGQLPVQRGELVAQVCRDHEVPVVPRRRRAAATRRAG